MKKLIREHDLQYYRSFSFPMWFIGLVSHGVFLVERLISLARPKACPGPLDFARDRLWSGGTCHTFLFIFYHPLVGSPVWFSQVKNRIKRIGKRWSDNGLQRWLMVVIQKIFTPENWSQLWVQYLEINKSLKLVTINVSYNWLWVTLNFATTPRN